MQNFMQGGMFGPSGGPQGMGGLTEQELRMVMGGQRGGIGGQMPQYNQAPAGGPGRAVGRREWANSPNKS